MNSRTLLTISLVTLFAGCAGAPESETVEPFNTGGGFGGTGGSGGILKAPAPPDICSVPEPGPIDLDTEWNGKTSLWGNHEGVVVPIHDKLDGTYGYFGIDLADNILVWYGVSTHDRSTEVYAMAGSCHPWGFPPDDGNQATVGKLPQTPPPTSGGGEKHNWPYADCLKLRSIASEAFTLKSYCNY